jgi:hypothetical protein
MFIKLCVERARAHVWPGQWQHSLDSNSLFRGGGRKFRMYAYICIPRTLRLTLTLHMTCMYPPPHMNVCVHMHTSHTQAHTPSLHMHSVYSRLELKEFFRNSETSRMYAIHLRTPHALRLTLALHVHSHSHSPSVSLSLTHTLTHSLTHSLRACLS